MRKQIILCIDDYEAALRGRQILFEEEGYEVLTATDGRGGLQLFESHPVEVVVLDYQMPEMNGDVVACQMKSLKPEVPIVLLSAHRSLPEDKLKFIDAFVSKDEPIQVLSAAVRELLNPCSAFNHWMGNWQARLTSLDGHSEPPKRNALHEHAWPDDKRVA